MEDFRTKVISFVERFGPILPIQISKELNTNLIFAGAILSELVSRKSLNVTHVKKGGSPYYYVKGQEEKMQSLSINLNNKEKEAYNLLRENLVLMDINLEPWQRVAIRDLKDFAKKIEYNQDGNNHIFWRWYLISEEESFQIIKDGLLEGQREEQIVNSNEEKLDIKEEKPKEITEDIKNFDSEIKTEEKIEVKGNLDINKLMNGYFDKNKIKVLGSHVVRKNSEINYEVEISSDIGILKYLAKFKNKKIINDKDLSVALSDGLNLGLPVIIYSNGVLNKKGREFLSKKSTYLIFKTIQ